MQFWKHQLAGTTPPGFEVTGQPVSRRTLLKGGVAAAGVAALAGPLARPADAAPNPRAVPHRPHGPFNDDVPTLESIRARWDELGVLGDQRGTLRHVTPAKTTDALQSLRHGTVHTYDLSERMYPGVPAFPADPPRRFDIWIAGYDTGSGNRFVFLDERFESLTFQIGTQVDQLNHPSYDGVCYGGYTFDDIVPLWTSLQDPAARAAQAAADAAAENFGPGSILGGTSALGLENYGPIVTRGILFDVLGYKQSMGVAAALSAEGDTLAPGYRITLEDLEGTLAWQGVKRGIEPGDVVVIRTGWHTLWDDPSRWGAYLGPAPGPYLAEARWLAAHHPAIVASDTYAFEVFPGPDFPDALAPVHQLLMTQEGIRIGEGFVSDGLAADGVYEFVFIDAPYRAPGATAAGNGPAALGVPRAGRR
jgi:kynurenine formamidase